MNTQDQRLIERGFPCHQVGAETQRERDTGQAPPINRLHVSWARRLLTPSHTAIVASLADADTDPETFVRPLGIERVQALVQEEPWILDAALMARVRYETSSAEVLPVDAVVLRALRKEDERRANNRELIVQMIERDATLAADPVLVRWSEESKPLPQPWPIEDELLPVSKRPDAAMLLAHLSQRNPDQVGPYLDQMRGTEDFGEVAAQAFVVVEREDDGI